MKNTHKNWHFKGKSQIDTFKISLHSLRKFVGGRLSVAEPKGETQETVCHTQKEKDTGEPNASQHRVRAEPGGILVELFFKSINTLGGGVPHLMRRSRKWNVDDPINHGYLLTIDGHGSGILIIQEISDGHF